MHILLDKNVPVQVRAFLTGHLVSDVAKEGWGTLSNGDLLRQAEASKFDVLVTSDQNIQHQQNLSRRTIAVVVLDTKRRRTIEADPQRLVDAVNAAMVGSCQTVVYPKPQPKRRPGHIK